ncbi:MAG: hypothetical protein QOI73_3207 [Solirubrobacteraceae bacterium]|nr:hypothetical protein [Solirubrobacteraceae bacterium]
MRRLRAVRALEDKLDGGELVLFCGHCGAAPAQPAAEHPSRVCAHCGLGLVLSAAPAIAPVAGEPFLVVDSTLSVCAVSAHAEELLRVEETQAVNRHIADFLVPADANAPGADNLLVLLVDAAAGSGEPRTTVVRPREEYGVRFHARIGACGPPHAALLVLTS